MEENTLGFGTELKFGEDEVVLMKEGMVDAHGLLLAYHDKELPVQQHQLMINFELQENKQVHVQAWKTLSQPHDKQGACSRLSSLGIP